MIALDEMIANPKIVVHTPAEDDANKLLEALNKKGVKIFGPENNWDCKKERTCYRVDLLGGGKTLFHGNVETYKSSGCDIREFSEIADFQKAEEPKFEWLKGKAENAHRRK